ncbi:hypothetical protein CEXT_422621 [Caerostris extrusa]|uniref:Uncharacterized protein n=1 Tax=Caerostris extrusa TaxID=172846 RepID=A0AAV4MCG1_CAEEX|nr:hypothetical protein CEXT_422621 [Caerostris extrusa]
MRSLYWKDLNNDEMVPNARNSSKPDLVKVEKIRDPEVLGVKRVVQRRKVWEDKGANLSFLNVIYAATSFHKCLSMKELYDE